MMDLTRFSSPQMVGGRRRNPPRKIRTFGMFQVVDDFDVLVEVMDAQAKLQVQVPKKRAWKDRTPYFLKNSNNHVAPSKTHTYHIQQPR